MVMIGLRWNWGMLPLLVFGFLGAGCADNRPDAEVVEGLRGLYPGDWAFQRYKERVIARGEEIVPELIAASHDSDPEMRESVARCLGHIGSDAAVDRLIEMADDDEIEDTVWIGLSYAGDSKAVPKLEEELASHDSERARGRILITLAECGDRTRLWELLDLMKTSSLPGHVYHANQAFEEIAGKRFGKDPAKIELWLRTTYPRT